MKLKASEILAIVSISVTILFGIIYRDHWKEGVIVGLIFTTAILVIDLKISITETNRNLEGKLDKLEEAGNNLDQKYQIIINNINNTKSYIYDSNNKILRLIKIRFDYLHEEELFSALNKIISLADEAKVYNYNFATYCKMLNSKIEEVKKLLNDGFSTFTRDDEYKRAAILDEIVLNSSDYIYAVTFDENKYIDIFWNGLFQDQYVTSNLQAANRGTQVERIFIVDQKLIKNVDLSIDEQKKRKNLVEICRKLNNGHQKCLAYWISKESIPQSLQNTNTSFLICDDFHASESHGIKGGQPINDGYVYQGGDTDKIEKNISPLKQRFFAYKRCKNEADCIELFQ